MSENANNIETWAVVEIMGHQKAIGYCTTQPFGTTVMLRVDTPELAEQQFERYGDKYVASAEPARTEYIGMGSIFRLTPCTEAFARDDASRSRRMDARLLDDSNVRPAIAGPVAGDELYRDEEML